MAYCPNCSNELKIAIFGGINRPYKLRVVSFINALTKSSARGYCEKCGPEPLKQAQATAKVTQAGFKSTLNEHIHQVPIFSLQAPQSWTFTPIGLVTGQSVTGTGVFSEFASSWSDFFGAQSKAYNQKIAGGEEICKTQLRLKCVEAGGNAILAADIDYAEVGGQKGMLMVCMTGTAVMLENLEVLGTAASDSLAILTATAKENQALLRYPDLITETNPGKLTDNVPA